MSKQTTYQFIRLDGYRRGPASKRHTVGSIVAEGLRHPTHISHIPGAPRFNVQHLDGPISDPEELPAWISSQMSRAKNPLSLKGKIHYRGVRKDAIAIGTIIASLPETLEHFDRDRFERFTEDTTDWAREFLASRDMLLHFRLEHLDELYPHMHLWFTPKGVELGDGTWSFASVLGRQKEFLHNFQMGYFDAVGHKYADSPSRPMEDRKIRLPRYMAIQQRDAETQNVVRRIREGDITALGNAPGEASPIEAIGRLVGQLQESEIDSIPAINRRLAALRTESSRHGSRVEALEKELAKLKAVNESLRSELTEKNLLLANNNTVEPQVDQVSLLKADRDAIFTGANAFIREGVWSRIVGVLLKYAHRNMNRAFHVSREEWEQLVIEDALPEIIPTNASGDVSSVDYWLREATNVLRASDIHTITNSPYKAFADLPDPLLGGSPKPAPAPNVETSSRFRPGPKDTSSTDDPWAGLGQGQ